MEDPQLNIVVFSGRLDEEPELRHTKTGKALCVFKLAIPCRYKTSKGEWKSKKPILIEINVWGEKAKKARETLKKGSPVTVQGKLDFFSWEEFPMTTKSKYFIVADIILPGMTRDPYLKTEKVENRNNEIPF